MPGLSDRPTNYLHRAEYSLEANRHGFHLPRVTDTWSQRHHVPSKHWYQITLQCNGTSQRNAVLSNTTMKQTKLKKIVLPWLLKKFPTFYGDLKAHYHVHNTPQSLSILYHTYPVHAFPSCFSTIHFDITFSTTPKSCKWSPTNTQVVFSIFHRNPSLPVGRVAQSV